MNHTIHESQMLERYAERVREPEIEGGGVVIWGLFFLGVYLVGGVIVGYWFG